MNYKRKIKFQNEILVKRIEQAKNQLIRLEKFNGKKEFMIPNIGQKSIFDTVNSGMLRKIYKNPGKEKKTENTVSKFDEDIHVGRLDMRVGKIIEISKHPNASTLYVEKIDCGEEELRTVCSGLVNNMPIIELENRMVVILCNLKPVKMRGITSEAMVMCAVSSDRTEVLDPPAGSIPGDLVHCFGYFRQPDSQLSNKKKTFELIASDLQTNGKCVACYKASPLIIQNKGSIVAQTLKNIKIK